MGKQNVDQVILGENSKHLNENLQILQGDVGPLTLKFDRATGPFLKIDRRH